MKLRFVASSNLFFVNLASTKLYDFDPASVKIINMKLPWSKKVDSAKSVESTGISTPENVSTLTQQSPETSTQIDPEKEKLSTVDNGENALSKEVQVEGAEPVATGNKEPGLTRTASAATTSSAGEPGQDDESKYLGGLPLYLLTFGLFIATFCVALDNTILATAIPRITTVFNSLNDVGWYGSAYLLTTTSLQPSFGKIYIYFNVKWTYIIALLIFEAGSVVCGAAVNSTMLIVGRAIAGIGAAALFSGGMNIIGYTVPLRKRPIFIGLLSSVFGVASIIGPIMGGALTDRVSWRWWYVFNLLYSCPFCFVTNPFLVSTSTFLLAPSPS
jgi:hypothetical protein